MSQPTPADTSVAETLRTAAAVLAWFRDMGADAAVGDEALNWLVRGNVRPGATFEMPEVARPPASATLPVPVRGSTHPLQPPQPLSPRPTPSSPVSPRPAMLLAPFTAPAPNRQFPTSAPDDAVLAARETAKAAQSIDDLQARLAAFEGCGLKATAKSLCFYRGAAAARVMIIGEAPGAEDDKIGKPLVGPAGQMLDKMLACIGLGEVDAHITNIVYWRPPGNRTPTPQEVMICRPFLERQVELVQPQFLVLLGGTTAKFILDDAEGIMKLRGKWRDVTLGNITLRAMATLNPGALLRTPLSKRMAWRDMLTLDAALKGIGKT